MNQKISDDGVGLLNGLQPPFLRRLQAVQIKVILIKSLCVNGHTRHVALVD